MFFPPFYMYLYIIIILAGAVKGIFFCSLITSLFRVVTVLRFVTVYDCTVTLPLTFAGYWLKCISICYLFHNPLLQPLVVLMRSAPQESKIIYFKTLIADYLKWVPKLLYVDVFFNLWKTVWISTASTFIPDALFEKTNPESQRQHSRVPEHSNQTLQHAAFHTGSSVCVNSRYSSHWVSILRIITLVSGLSRRHE